MSNRITIKTCDFCGENYHAKKCDSLYCSPTCRKYAYIESFRTKNYMHIPDTYISYRTKQKREQDTKTFIKNAVDDAMAIFQPQIDEIKNNIR